MWHWSKGVSKIQNDHTEVSAFCPRCLNLMLSHATMFQTSWDSCFLHRSMHQAICLQIGDQPPCYHIFTSSLRRLIGRNWPMVMAFLSCGMKKKHLPDATSSELSFIDTIRHPIRARSRPSPCTMHNLLHLSTWAGHRPLGNLSNWRNVCRVTQVPLASECQYVPVEDTPPGPCF